MADVLDLDLQGQGRLHPTTWGRFIERQTADQDALALLYSRKDVILEFRRSTPGKRHFCLGTEGLTKR